MVMCKLKACPRCGGDIFIDRELDVWYEQCLQCVDTRDVPSILEVHQHSDDRKEEELSKLDR